VSELTDLSLVSTAPTTAAVRDEAFTMPSVKVVELTLRSASRSAFRALSTSETVRAILTALPADARSR
jgi:hypothetical protein